MAMLSSSSAHVDALRASGMLGQIARCREDNSDEVGAGTDDPDTDDYDAGPDEATDDGERGLIGVCNGPMFTLLSRTMIEAFTAPACHARDRRAFSANLS